MNLIKNNPLLVGGAVLVVGLFVWIQMSSARNVAGSVASGTIGAADGVIGGTVQGLTGIFGIPETGKTQCEQDQAAGNTWAASASCPAGTFIKGLFK